MKIEGLESVITSERFNSWAQEVPGGYVVHSAIKIEGWHVTSVFVPRPVVMNTVGSVSTSEPTTPVYTDPAPVSDVAAPDAPEGSDSTATDVAE